MRRLLFAHDHYFLRLPDGRIFSPGRLPYRAWGRYLEVFDEVVVCARVKDVETVEGLVESGGPKVTFMFLPNLSNLSSLIDGKRATAKKIVLRELVNVTAVAVRLPSEIGLMVANAAARDGKPIAAEMVGSAWAMLSHGIKGKLYALLLHWRLKKAVLLARSVIYVTNEALQKEYPAGGKDWAAASNVEIPESEPQTLARRMERISRGQGTFVIGTIGALGSSLKGLGVLLKAVARVHGDLGDFVIQVVGDGKPEHWKKKARNLGIEKFVHFVGVLPPGQAILGWLDSVDLYVHPSFREGLPRALIEAMSRACPALASNAGGTSELLSFHCLHRPGQYMELAEQLLNRRYDLMWQRQVGTRNFEFSKRFSPTIVQEARRVFWRRFAETC
ncbi:MAG TPA: glycosyltransferase family 4 protein [Burkholderiales bacterium]|nr:glycosyltransferase family 4 protein [Burkholderiales bacterium]